jgi:hypothetical protein
VKAQGSVRRHVPAGVADATIASIASFGAGLTGVTLLTETDRGVYGVFFTAFMLGGIIVSELIYVPAQVVAVAAKRPTRLASVSKALRLGLIPSAIGALVAVIAGILMRNEAPTETIVALVVTTSVTILFSPMQNHVRKMLHIAERSWDAAKVSVAQLLVVAVAILILTATSVHRAWIPFGSLAIANSASLAFGWILARAEQRSGGDVRLEWRKLVASGKWLVLRASLPAAFAFAAANVLVQLAGSVAYGHAEAARQVAQPIIVLATGLVAVLGPHSMRAGMTLDSRTSWRTWRAYAFAISGASILYIVLVGWSWALNPMERIVPAAYEVRWLVPVTVTANVISALVMLLTSEIIGAGRTKVLAGLSAMTSPALLIVSFTAGTTGAFARPFGLILEGVLRFTGARFLLRHHYAAGIAPPSDTGVIPPVVTQ